MRGRVVSALARGPARRRSARVQGPVAIKRPSATLAACSAAWLLLSAGCATQTFHVHGGGVVALDETQRFFIDGLGQQSTRNAAEVCGGPERVARVQAYRSLGDVLASFVTLGIYSPAHAKVHCLE